VGKKNEYAIVAPTRFNEKARYRGGPEKENFAKGKRSSKHDRIVKGEKGLKRGANQGKSGKESPEKRKGPI